MQGLGSTTTRRTCGASESFCSRCWRQGPFLVLTHHFTFQLSGQAVVTGVFPSPPAGICLHFLSRRGLSIPTANFPNSLSAHLPRFHSVVRVGKPVARFARGGGAKPIARSTHCSQHRRIGQSRTLVVKLVLCCTHRGTWPCTQGSNSTAAAAVLVPLL